MWINHYWIKLISLWQDVSYRRLALALVISLLLHLFLIGNFNFSLPSWEQKRNLMEVRLFLPKVALQSQPKLIEDIKPAVKPVKLEIPPALKETLPPESVNQPSSESPELLNLPSSDDVIMSEPPPMQQVEAESPLEALVPLNKPKPYEYVESDFDVYTDIDTEQNRTPVGRANMVFQQLPNGEQYKIRSLIQAKGLVSLVIPDLLQTSEGFFDQSGLYPAHYLYQFGDKKDKTFNADFNWNAKKLTLKSEKGEQQLDLPVGTQDLLSFMYQFMYVPPLQNMQLSVTNGKKIGTYEYVFMGEEIIATSMGNLNTYHIERAAEEGEKKTELWLSLDYQHVPVKIRETDKQGKVYELVLTGIKTEAPVISHE